MRLFYLFVFLTALWTSANAQSDNEKLTPEQQKLTDDLQRIKDNTNWNDPEAIKKGFKEIGKLVEQSDKEQGKPVTPIDTLLKEEPGVMGQYQADRVTENILHYYYVDTSYMSSEYAQSLTFLTINMKKPDPRFTLQNVGTFPNITTLFIIGAGTSIDLESLFQQLEDKNITELYIVRNGAGTIGIPETIGKLTHLQRLGLYGNQILTLPTSISKLTNLEELYIDANPITALPSSMGQLKKLTQLGIAKTNIDNNETARIQKLLPTCKILLQ